MRLPLLLLLGLVAVLFACFAVTRGADGAAAWREIDPEAVALPSVADEADARRWWSFWHIALSDPAAATLPDLRGSRFRCRIRGDGAIMILAESSAAGGYRLVLGEDGRLLSCRRTMNALSGVARGATATDAQALFAAAWMHRWMQASALEVSGACRTTAREDLLDDLADVAEPETVARVPGGWRLGWSQHDIVIPGIPVADGAVLDEQGVPHELAFAEAEGVFGSRTSCGHKRRIFGRSCGDGARGTALEIGDADGAAVDPPMPIGND